MSLVSLNMLQPGEACRLDTLNLYGGFRRRLRDLGFLPGSRIECVLKAPGGSPIAFAVKGALLALRVEECRNILVKRCE